MFKSSNQILFLFIVVEYFFMFSQIFQYFANCDMVKLESFSKSPISDNVHRQMVRFAADEPVQQTREDRIAQKTGSFLQILIYDLDDEVRYETGSFG